MFRSRGRNIRRRAPGTMKHYEDRNFHELETLVQNLMQRSGLGLTRSPLFQTVEAMFQIEHDDSPDNYVIVATARQKEFILSNTKTNEFCTFIEVSDHETFYGMEYSFDELCALFINKRVCAEHFAPSGMSKRETLANQRILDSLATSS